MGLPQFLYQDVFAWLPSSSQELCQLPEACLLLDDAQDLGDKVILLNLNERLAQAARMMAWSKSGCSKSLMVLALLRLPVPCVSQRGDNPEIKPGEGIQTLPQLGQNAFGLTDLLADGPEHGSDTRGLG